MQYIFHFAAAARGSDWAHFYLCLRVRMRVCVHACVDVCETISLLLLLLLLQAKRK